MVNMYGLIKGFDQVSGSLAKNSAYQEHNHNDDQQ
jgi:hypothetical protein